ncbi:peripherin-2-like [Sinocyclocheilus rhinocerous]|uniref:peripherin-2-like n=1 Tax=Sinocyclocheilus rhinocerous TaxID=307959 RepID=UPI0007B870B7|nr:PREDICTED: peripherin-2-like [Sinocyclocheilus rhinocerous]
MVLLKIKFPFQKRVRLAQGLWLLSWVAMFSGAITFAMGVFLKTELHRRSEVIKLFLIRKHIPLQDTDTPGHCFQKETIDRLQIEFQCCGNTNYRDWFEVQWISNHYLDFTSKEVKDRVRSNVDGRYLLDGVPFSCCNPASPRPCIQYSLLDNSAHYNYEYQSEELNLYNRGCRQALVNYYMGLMNTIGPCVLFDFLLQMTILVSLRYLQTAMEGVIGQENVEIETEGYILEKGVKETLLETKEKMKKFLQFAQVGDASAATPDTQPEAEKPATA